MKKAGTGIFFAGVATLATVAATAAWLYNGNSGERATPAAGKADAKPVIGSGISPAPGAGAGLASLGGAVAHGAKGWRIAETAIPAMPRTPAITVPPPSAGTGAAASGLGNWSQGFSAYGDPTGSGVSGSSGGSGSGLYAMATPSSGSGAGFAAPGFAGLPSVPAPPSGPQASNAPTGGTPAPGSDPGPGNPGNTPPQPPGSGPSGDPNPGSTGLPPPTQPISLSGPPLVPASSDGPPSDPTPPGPPQAPPASAGPTPPATGPASNSPVIASGNPPSMPSPGRSPQTAFMPTNPGVPYVLTVDNCISSACESNGWQFFDPLVAIGYDYQLTPTNPGDRLTFGITDIQVSTVVGDGIYQLFLCTVGETVCDFATGQDIIGNDNDTSADIFDVTAYLHSLSASQLALLGITNIEDGIFGFALRGIDPADALGPDDRFVTGLLFTGDVNGSVVITPELVETNGVQTVALDGTDAPRPIPEPPAWLAFFSGLALLVPRLRARIRAR